MEFYERAKELKTETIENRRYIHQNAEVGLDLPKTKAFVMNKLKEYGIDAKECGYGVTATLGKPGKVILLRADMDALCMPEESGEPFACPTKEQAHACGHDLHAAMLLSAAKMLKEREDELEGTVKLMFQPAEETFEGCKNMIEHGILEEPKVDAALAFHVGAGKAPVGMIMYNSTGRVQMSSVDGFKIEILGKGSHGANPHESIDPINIGVHIYQAFQQLIARESNPAHASVLTIGQFAAGQAANIIPEVATLQGTIRTNHVEARELLVRRIKEIAQGEAAIYGAKAEVTMISEIPSLISDQKLVDEMIGYIRELNIENMMEYPGVTANGSEDFALIAERVPSAYMYLGAGFQDERGDVGAHNPKVVFNEDVCPIGAASLAHCAMQWLKKNQ